jgi:hypothetical protein
MTAPNHRRKVLIVVSAWSPAMIADMQRARMLAWHLPDQGWDVEILTPAASEVRQDVIEPDPSGFFPAGTPVHEVGSTARELFAALGSRTHAWRTLWPMKRRGLNLLRSGRFDLAFFTTTTFVYFSLGAYWQRHTGVPYVLDFHDPWVKDRAKSRRSGSLLSRLAASVSEAMERDAVSAAAAVVAVSQVYIDTLGKRYAAQHLDWLERGRHACISFGAHAGDLAQVAQSVEPRIGKGSEQVVLRYVGAGGSIMLRSFEVICRALAALREQQDPLVARLRLELLGTMYNWQPGDARELQQVAANHGLGDVVTEEPGRVSYRRSLELLLQADGAIVLGVDDAGYMPSKLYSYALSGKPLLASLHRQGPAFARLQGLPELGHALWFDNGGQMPIDAAAAAMAEFLREATAARLFDRRKSLAPFLAPNMARRHAELFERCLEPAHDQNQVKAFPGGTTSEPIGTSQ